MVYQITLLLLLGLLFPNCSSVRRDIGGNGEDEENESGDDSQKSPVVFVAPLMGSVLDVKVGSPWTSWRLGCNYPWWSKAWGTRNFIKLRPKCFDRNFRLKWDDKEKAGINNAGIKVRPHVGRTSWRALNVSGGDVFYKLRTALVKDGRTLDKAVIPHAYDWRLSVRQWETTAFPTLKAQIEGANKHSNKRSVVVSLSMGGSYFHRFLQWVDDEWKRAHIEAFVPIGAPFAGATSAVFTAFAGVVRSYHKWKYDLECPSCIPPLKNKTNGFGFFNIVPNIGGGFVDTIADFLEDKVQDTVLSFPCLYFVMPKVDTSQTPPRDPIIVDFPDGVAHKRCLVNPSKKFTGSICGASSTRDNYTIKEGFLTTNQCAECKWTRDNCSTGDGFEFARQWGSLFWRFYLCCKRHECETRVSLKASELPSLFRRVGYRNMEMEAQMSQDALEHPTVVDPGVPVHCIFETNTQTISQVHLNSDLSMKGLVVAEGDGTVDGSSLRVCERWNSTVRAYALPNIKHATAHRVDEVIDLILAIARGDKPFWEAWKPPEYNVWKDPSLIRDMTPPKNMIVAPRVRIGKHA